MLTVFRREVPTRPTLFEFFLNDRLHTKLAPQPETETERLYARERQVMQAYLRAGYDHCNVLVPNFEFPSLRTYESTTISLNEGGMISDWTSFEAYQWPDPEAADYAILDDMREIGIDVRHSYEDNILPVKDAYDRYRDCFAIFGGLDVDFVCRATPEEVYQRAKTMLARTAGSGGYALGTGNSVPDEGYFAMIRAALELQ